MNLIVYKMLSITLSELCPNLPFLCYNTQIPACLWFLTRNKTGGKYRKRTGETLFIDARKMGVLIDRVHRELTEEEISRIAKTYDVL